MKLTGQQARHIVVYEDFDPDIWECQEPSQMEGTTRWSIHFSRVMKYLPDDTYWLFNWSEGATESQDEIPFEYDDEYEPVQVKPKQVTVTKWEEVK